ncbi:MAG: amidase [Chloroflexota bacterium]|nr:amidase [Chloroflexota bacterium]
MTGEEALSLSIAELGRTYRRREVSPVEATAAALQRIERLDPQLHSFITVTSDLAMKQAAAAEQELARGMDRGPLHGVPIGLKDLYATKGIRTTAHSKILQDWIPDEDATVTTKLYQAGVVLLGKLAMHEFAWGPPPDFDLPFPPARNPWDLERVPGGSSSGSGVALAARLCFGAMGSDTGGSIRSPAHLCGIVGLKTTYGLVSRHGVVPLSWSLDSCGPMARTVEDCAILLQAIAGRDPADPASADRPLPNYRAALGGAILGRRIGVPRSWIFDGDGPDPDVAAAFETALSALQDLGAELVDVDGRIFVDARYPQMVIMMSEAYAYHEANFKARPQDYGPVVRNRLREVAVTSAADYIQAQRARTVISREIDAVFAHVDAVVTPMAARPAERFQDYSPAAAARITNFSGAFNLYGGPAICVPCGFSRDGLPIGLQIAGRHFDEPAVLSLAYAYEQVASCSQQEPPVLRATHSRGG